MSSIMAEAENFKRLKNHLQNGNVEELRENLEQEFVDKIIDNLFGWRPIHYACRNNNIEIVKLLIEKKCNIESEDNKGWRPIHYACDVGNIEIVKLLIETKCNIEIKDKWGWKPIHYSSLNGHFDIVNLLIEKKCNLESEDMQGRRPIHYACLNGHCEIIKLFIEKKCNIESEDIEKKRPIHYASENDNIKIAKLLVEKKCNIESKDKWGQRPIHYACSNGNFEIVKLLIENKCDIESQDIKGWRPIHFVSENGNIKIMKLLIFLNCQIDAKERDELTPLNLARSSGHEEIVKLISDLNKVSKQIKDSIMKNYNKGFAKFYKSDILTGQDWLEMAWAQKADYFVKTFLNRPIDEHEINYIKTAAGNIKESNNSQLWEEVLLYKCIKDHHEEGFQGMCRANIINRSHKIIPCSFLEFAAKNGNVIFVQEILKKSIFDSEIWESAKNIALQNNYHQIYNYILKREYLLKCRQRDNISILHTAVCDNDPDMLEYILDRRLVNPNHNHEVFGTSLAFSILLCHQECLRIFERSNVAYDIQNKYLQSPLHEAVSNGMIEDCQYLIDRVENIDQSGFMGQTALHHAVMRGCEKLCDQLMEKGADCLRYIEFPHPFNEKKVGIPILKDSLKVSQRENALTLCVKMNRTIYPCFLKSLDRNKANSFDDEGNSLLHLSVKVLETKLSHILIKAGANVDSLNNRQNTPLSELLSDPKDQQSFITNEDKIIEIVNLFVQSGCDLNKSLKGEISLSKLISKFNCEKLLLALIPRQQNQLFEIDENLFRSALNKHFYLFLESLLNLFPRDLFKSSISTNIIETAVKYNCKNLLKSLVINASDKVQQIVSEFSLYHLAKLNDKDSFECLFNIEIKNPSFLRNGETLLTTLLKEKELYFCQQIIESKTNKKKYINFKNKQNQTPLQVAIESAFMDLVQNHLVFETEIVDNIDCEGRSALMQLFVKISNNDKKDQLSRLLSTIKAIICKEGNIYHYTSNRKKAIEFCCSPLIRAEIETFQKYQNNFIKKEMELTKFCGICLDREVDSVLDCGHTICEICSYEIERCPFCNSEPTRARRIYFN